MTDVLVVAPHPDDESLGAGGTLLHHKKKGDNVHWLIMTTTVGDDRFDISFTSKRTKEIERVSKAFGFSSTTILNFHPATLDHIPLIDLIDKISNVFHKIKPSIIYLPYRGDAHSDHKIVFDACISCTKSFRYPYVKSIRVYETLSETDFSLNSDLNGFTPNYYVNIEKYITTKVKILNIFTSEMKPPPFPRNEESIKALALLRGQVAGVTAAEAFMSLKEICDD